MIERISILQTIREADALLAYYQNIGVKDWFVSMLCQEYIHRRYVERIEGLLEELFKSVK